MQKNKVSVKRICVLATITLLIFVQYIVLVKIPIGEAQIPAGTQEYSPSTNTITLVGANITYPANFYSLWVADKSGLLNLTYRASRTAVDGSAVALTYNLRPTDLYVLGGVANDLYVNVTAWTSMTTATIQIAGTNSAGGAQTEDIVVTGTGAVYATKYFHTLTTSKVTVYTNSSSGSSFSYAVTQGQWGVVWKQKPVTGTAPEVRESQYTFDAKIVIGDGSTTTCFAQLSGQVVFSAFFSDYDTLMLAKNASVLTFGTLEDASTRSARGGVSFHTVGSLMHYAIRGEPSSTVDIYCSKFSWGYDTYGACLTGHIRRIWHCLFGARWSLNALSDSDVYDVYMSSNPMESAIAIQSPDALCTFEDVTVDSFASATEGHGIYRDCKFVNIADNFAILSMVGDGTSWFDDVESNIWTFIWSEEATQLVYRRYSFTLTVTDSEENPLSGIHVSIVDVNGTGAWSGTTNALGQLDIYPITLVYGTYDSAHGDTIQPRYPFTITMYDDTETYENYTTLFTPSKTLDWQIALQNYTEPEVTVNWLHGWDYRMNLTAIPSAGAGTFYQFNVITHYGSGTDGINEFYLNGHCESDFKDVKFTTSDGVTILSAQRLTYVVSDYASWEIVVADDVSTENVSLFLYYGNPNATLSDDDVFLAEINGMRFATTMEMDFGTNMMSNGGLETLTYTGDAYSDDNGLRALGWGFEDWASTSLRLFDNTTSHSGNCSAKIQNLTDNSDIVLACPEWNYKPDVVAGNTYTTTAWVKTDSLTGNGIGICHQFFNSSMYKLVSWSSPYVLTGTNDWTKITASYTAPAGAVKGDPIIVFWGIGTAWIDDVQYNATQLYDYSGYGNHGLLEGYGSDTTGTPQNGSGKFGSAMWFDTTHNSKIRVNDSDSLTTADAFTWAGWVYATKSSWGAGEEWASIMTKKEFGDELWWSIFSSWDVRVRFDSAGYVGDSNAVVANGQWEFVMVTWNGTYVKYYIDGDFDKEDAYSGTIDNLPYDLIFGVSGSNYHYEGGLDNVFILDYALNDANATLLWNNYGDMTLQSGLISVRKYVSPEPYIVVAASESGGKSTKFEYLLPFSIVGFAGACTAIVLLLYKRNTRW